MVIAIAIVVTLVTILINYQSAEAQIRSVILEKLSIEDQAILDKFDDAKIDQNGTFIKFSGKQTLDPSLLQSLDNLSVAEEEQLADANVSYEFTYDAETNIVTISAEMINSLGEIEIDEIHGVAFYNDEGEIDAVMNVEGEPLLLSEMRDAGMIQNCGWFSKLIKKAAKVVAVAAVVVAAAAVVVATAGVAAPAVVGAGVAAVTVVSGSALAIAGYATITAAIAAGVSMTVDLWEQYYPGINVRIDKNIAYANKWNDKTIQAVKDILKAKLASKSLELYFPCDGTNYNPTNVQLIPVKKETMATMMSASGKSSLTMYNNAAYAVMSAAFPGVLGYVVKETDVYTEKGSAFVRHYHVLKAGQ